MDKESKYKTCIHCWHWSFYSGDATWSEVTPGTDWWMLCSKEHFHINGEFLNGDDLRKELLRAQTCDDFDERISLK